MAFGFIRKIVAAITGKGSPASNKGGRKQPAGSRRGPQQQSSRGGKNRRDARTHEGSARGRGGERRNGANARGTNDGQSGRGRRSSNGGNGSRSFNAYASRGGLPRKNRGPAPVNTAANEMRPGGIITEAERAARRQAHAAWNPDSFVVPEMEGKKRFHDFDLPAEVMHGIADLGFRYCTDIQALSLQHALEGKNVAGKAQTGSGKTAAFLVAILTRYLRTPESRAKTGGCPRALVIAPTRELVIQICKDADAIGRYCDLRSLAVYGGMDYDRQKREILDAPVDLLVATPGRLLDFCNQRVVDLSHVDTLVIDEADRMLDMGFIPDVRRIMGRLPPKNRRATMLYSATLTDDVMRLAAQWMEEPVRAEVESTHNATDTVRQVVYVVRAEDKFKVLFNHIALHPDARAIVFCNRKCTTDDVYESLRRRGVKCEMLSGDVSQNRRLVVLDNFRSGKIRIVVATDVAGRGIHVDDVEYVINFDFPYEAEDYVHRIGRTGRAGNTGIAISFADEDESFAIPDIEEYIREPLKCTVLQEDDPLLKPLEHLARGQKAELKPVDAAAAALVDAREAVTDEEKAAAAALVGDTMTVVNGAGKQGTVTFKTPSDGLHKMPTFEHALDAQAPTDETDAYAKGTQQQARTEEWNPSEETPAQTPQAN